MTSIVINFLIGWILSYITLLVLGVNVATFLLCVAICVIWNMTAGRVIKEALDE